MSLITRCTACQTLFKVVPDQLRISEGWVRCGQCGEVFDATLNLLAAEHVETPAAAPTAAVGRTAVVPSTDPASTPPPDQAAAKTAAAVQQGDEAQAPASTDHATPAHSSMVVAVPIPPPPRPEQITTADQDGADFSFMQDKRPARQGPAVAWALSVVSMVLLGVLALQVVRHERDRIAVLAPAVRPALLWLCSTTNCTVSPLRQLDSVLIDSSSFSRIRGDLYRLGFSLRNSASIDIAMPAIELSITDAQDQALSRRVILPVEFGASGQVLAAGSDWTGGLTLSVKTTGSAERVAGYRMLAFYP